jgi:hypothetical protein
VPAAAPQRHQQRQARSHQQRVAQAYEVDDQRRDVPETGGDQ